MRPIDADAFRETLLKLWDNLEEGSEKHLMLSGFIKALDLQSTVQAEPPAELFNKIKEQMVDEKDFAYADFEQYKVDCLGVDPEYAQDDLPQDEFRYGLERAMEIINAHAHRELMNEEIEAEDADRENRE